MGHFAGWDTEHDVLQVSFQQNAPGRSRRRTRAGARTVGRAPKRAMMSHDRSIAHDSICTRLCSIAWREDSVPPLPSLGIAPGSTSFTLPREVRSKLCGK